MKWRDPRLLLLVILAATALLRLRFLEVPLERDEGEYAYLGQLILDGRTPYVAAHNMKLPGVYYGYAAILALFGHSIAAIRFALLLVNLATAAFVYRLTSRLLDSSAGLVAAAVFGVLSLSESMVGFTANVEHFAILPVVAAFSLLVETTATTRVRIFASGLLLGLAYVMKQHAAVFIVCGGLYVVAAAWRAEHSAKRISVVLRNAIVFASGALLPFAVICLTMFLLGAFRPFWFWTVLYASEYASMFSFRQGLGELRHEALRVFSAPWSLWGMAACGLFAMLASDRLRAVRTPVIGFTVASVLAVATGWRFREHYFLFLVPAASLLAGAGTSAVVRLTAGGSTTRHAALWWLLPTAVIGAAIVQQKEYLFTLAPEQVSRRVFGFNPFPESIEVARYLRENSAPGDSVAVIGSEPQIYFYSHLRAATSYIYMYPLMEPHPFARRMQEEMLAQLQREQPTFLVLINVDASWLRQPDSSTLVFDWSEKTVNEGYDLVGLVQLRPGRDSLYLWGKDALRAPAPLELYMTVFRRRQR